MVGALWLRLGEEQNQRKQVVLKRGGRDAPPLGSLKSQSASKSLKLEKDQSRAGLKVPQQNQQEKLVSSKGYSWMKLGRSRGC